MEHIVFCYDFLFCSVHLLHSTMKEKGKVCVCFSPNCNSDYHINNIWLEPRKYSLNELLTKFDESQRKGPLITCAREMGK